MSSPTDRMRDDLRRLYDDLRDAIEAHAPTCRLSGRCCRFVEYDHVLYLTDPERDLLLAESPPPLRPLDDGQTCPWQDARGRCAAREARPLGCRLYYCDPAFEAAMHDLAERFVARLKALHRQHRLTWNYAPLHRHLREALQAGLGHDPDPRTPPDPRLDT